MLDKGQYKWRNSAYGFLSLFIVLAAFVINVESPSTGYTIGDHLLLALGLNDLADLSTESSYYLFILTILILCIGWLMVRYFWRETQEPRFIYVIIMTSLLFALAEPVYSIGYNAQFNFAKGLNAIEFYPNRSSITFYMDNGEYLANYSIALENHSEQKVEFYLQTQALYGTPLYIPGQIMYEEITNISEEGSISPLLFTLEGKERKILQFANILSQAQNLDIQYDDILLSSNTRPLIFLYDEESKRAFKQRERDNIITIITAP